MLGAYAQHRGAVYWRAYLLTYLLTYTYWSTNLRACSELLFGEGAAVRGGELGAERRPLVADRLRHGVVCGVMWCAVHAAVHAQCMRHVVRGQD